MEEERWWDREVWWDRERYVVRQRERCGERMMWWNKDKQREMVGKKWSDDEKLKITRIK